MKSLLIYFAVFCLIVCIANSYEVQNLRKVAKEKKLKKFMAKKKMNSKTKQDEEDEPSEEELEKSENYSIKLANKLFEEGANRVPEQDERVLGDFERKNTHLDPFIDYLSYLRDKHLKPYQIVTEKEMRTNK